MVLEAKMLLFYGIIVHSSFLLKFDNLTFQCHPYNTSTVEQANFATGNFRESWG